MRCAWKLKRAFSHNMSKHKFYQKGSNVGQRSMFYAKQLATLYL